MSKAAPEVRLGKTCGFFLAEVRPQPHDGELINHEDASVLPAKSIDVCSQGSQIFAFRLKDFIGDTEQRERKFVAYMRLVADLGGMTLDETVLPIECDSIQSLFDPKVGRKNVGDSSSYQERIASATETLRAGASAVALSPSRYK